MKTNRSLFILSGGVAAIIGTLLVWRFCPSASSPISSDFGNSTVVSNQPTLASATNTLLVDHQTDVTTKTEEVGGFYKTKVDQESGQYAIVNSNRTTVTLRDINGKTIWSSDAIKIMPLSDQKYYGNKISYMELVRNELHVFIGKACFMIDKKTGQATSLGAD